MEGKEENGFTKEEVLNLKSSGKNPFNLEPKEEPTGVQTEKSQYDFGFVLPETKPLEALQENRAQQQSIPDRVANTVPRLIEKVGSEVAKTPGYLYALGEAGVTQKPLSETLNNAWLNTLENLDQKTKNQFAIYTPKAVKDGNLWDNLTSTSFWTDEGVDGAGFLLAMMAPGAVLRGANIAGKLTKVGVGINAARNIELGLATTINTSLESASEAKGLVDKLKPQLDEQVKKGEITQEEATQKLGEAGRNSFLQNMVLLAGPKFLMNKNIFGRFIPTKTSLSEIVDEAGKLIKPTELTRGAKLAHMTKELGLNIGSEGFVEEGGQNAIENYNEKFALGKTNSPLIKGLAEAYIEGLHTTEGQKSILLGGFFSSIGAYVGNKGKANKEFEGKTQLYNIMQNNFEGFSKKLDNIYEKDEQGNIKLDNVTKEPVLNKESVGDYLANIALEHQSSALKDVYAGYNNKEAYDYITNKEFTRFVIPYLQQEGGLEALDKHLSEFSNKLVKNEKEIRDVDNTLTEGQHLLELKTKARKLSKAYESIDNTLNFKSEEDSELANEFTDKLKNAALQETSGQLFLADRINKTNLELMDLEFGVSKDIPQNIIEAKKLKKQLENYNESLNESIKNYKNFFNRKEQEETFKQWLETKKEVKKTTDDLENKKKKDEEDAAKLAKKEEVTQAVNDIEAKKEYEKSIKDFTLKLTKKQEGEKLTPEEHQFYENNSEDVEQELKNIAARKAKSEEKPIISETEKDIITSNTTEETLPQPPDLTSDKVLHDLYTKEDQDIDYKGMSPKSNLRIEDEEDKTIVVNLAYLSYKYNYDKEGKLITIYDTEGNSIKDKSDLRLLSPKIDIGTTLLLKVDTNYPNYKALSKDKRTTPIGVYLEGEDKPIAYIHDMDWVSKESNNIAESYQFDVEKKTKEIRDKVLDSETPIEVVITGKTIGRLNRIESKKKENNWGYVNTVIDSFGTQDKTQLNKFGESQIAIATSETTATIGENEIYLDHIHNKMKPGGIYMIIPTPVKDVNFASILKSSNLQDLKQTETIISAIEHFLSKKDKLILNNHNINTIGGLFKFINELTFIGKGQKRNAQTFDYNLVNDDLFLDIGATKSIKFNLKESAEKNLDKFKTIKEELTSVLDNKVFNVDKNKLQDSEMFLTYKVDSGVIKEDRSFGNYSDYLATEVLKSNLNPEFNEKERQFFHQSNISYNLKQDQEQEKKEVVKEKTTKESKIEEKKEEESDLYKDADEEGLDDIMTDLGLDRSPNFNKSDLKYYRAQELTLEQQDQIVNTALSLLNDQIEQGISPQESFDKVLKKFEGLYNIQSRKGQSDRARIVKLAIENWNSTEDFVGFKNLIESKLAQLGTTIENDELSDETGVLEKRNYSEGAVYKTNPKKTASANLKRFLSFITKVDKNGNPIPSILGTKTYYSFDELYTQILIYLADTPIEDMMGELQELATEKPQFKEVIDKLSTGSEQRRNEFFSNFRNRYSEFTSQTLASTDNDSSIYSRKSNMNSAEGIILNKWLENFKNKDLLSELKEGENIGNLIINKDKSKELLEEFNSIIKTSDIDLKKLQDLLNKVGVDIDIRALNDLKKNTFISRSSDFGTYFNKRKELQYKNFQSLLNDKLSNIFKSLAGEAKNQKNSDILFEENNPFINEGEALTLLAKAQKKYEDNLFNPSFRDSSGNNLFAYNKPTYLTDQILKLKTDDDYLQELKKVDFISTSTYLDQLIDRNSILNQVFNVTYYDAIRKQNSNDEPLEYSDMNKKSREIVKLGLFQNQGKSIAQITGLTFSDKGELTVYNVPKVDTRDWKNTNSKAFKALKMLALGELKRIALTQRQIEELPKNQLIKGYHTEAKMGLKSLLFTKLNSNEELFQEKELVTGWELKQEAINNTILEEVQSWIDNKNRIWKENDITSKDFDKTYISGKKVGIKEKIENFNEDSLFDYAVTDYVINWAITNGNMIQLVHGDPALTGKKGAKLEGYINKTYIEYFKRMAKDIAPGTEMQFKTDKFNTLFIRDIDFSTDITKKFTDRDDVVKSTDAQEVTTTQEHLDVMFARGLIKDDIYNSISEKIEKHPNDYDSKFTKEELDLVMQPMKPVYVGGDIQNNINKISYIKTSSYPLLPSLVKDTNMDNLRKLMEESKVQRAVFTSGVKMGTQGIISLYNSNGDFTLTKEEVDHNKVTLPREGFKIQQDNPQKEEERIIQATQQRKLLWVDIDNSYEFNYNNKKLNREELKKIYDNSHIELLNIKFDNLLKEFNFKVDDKGNYTIEDLSTFSDFLKKEGISRGWNPNELAAIEVNKETNTFRIPLMYAPMTEKIESLLTSILTNNLVRSKLPGHSYIQGSSIGYETKEKSLYKDPALKYMQKDKTGFYSEVQVPWNYERLNYEDYVNEDGTPKLDKIDESLLYLIGYRIPNQGHNSMLRLKIIKFLKPQVGDLMLVPSEVTFQMGSDFDVDKMNTYHINWSKTKEDKLVKYDGEDRELQLENEIIDINNSVLSNEKMQERIQHPLDSEGLRHAVDQVRQILDTDKHLNFILTDELSDKAFEDNKSGKILTATTSLSATNHALAQDANLYISPQFDREGGLDINKDITIRFKSDSNKEYNDSDFKGNSIKEGTYPEMRRRGGSWRLDKLVGFTNRLISQVISGLQSAAVDNAKEQLINQANITNNTYNVAALIARTGFDESFIVPFLVQESLVEVNKRLEAISGDITLDNTNKLKKKDVLNNYLSELEKLAEFNIEELTAFSRDELKDLLKQSKEDKTKEYYLAQAQILYNFIQYDKVATEIVTLQSSTNPETQGVGKSLSNMIYKQNQIDKVQVGFKYLGNSQNIFNDTFIGDIIDKTIYQGNSMYKNLFPYADEAFLTVKEAIKAEYGDDRMISVEEDDKINRELKAALYSNVFTNENLFQERQSLLIDSKENKSLATRLRQYKGTNSFFKKLSTDLTVKTGEPSYIKYNASVAEDEGEALTNSIAWQDALNSSNEEEKKFAEDLVKYVYLTGGVQTKSSFVKYVPVSYFESKLKEKVANLTDPSTFEHVLSQFFQHNPWRAKQINPKLYQLKLLKTAYENGKLKENYVPETFTLDINNSNSQDLTVENNGKIVFPNYLSLRIKKQWHLYESNGVTEKGDYSYKKINTLGHFNLKEYDLLQPNSTSIISTNNIKTNSPVSKGAEINSTSKNESINTKKEDSKIVKAIKENDIKTTLNSIIEANVRQSGLAKFLLDKINGVNIGVDPVKNNDRKGYQQNNSVYINLDLNKVESDLFDTILHETIHSLTANKVDIYEQYKLDNNRRSLTDQDIDTIKSIENLMNLTKSKFKDTSKLTKYAYSTPKEFIAYAMTDVDFQKLLNSEKLANNKSLFDKFIDLISKLIGLDIQSGSILAETIKGVIDLISPNIENTGSINLSPMFDKIKTTGDLGLDKFLHRWENQKRILERQKTRNPDQAAEKQREIDQLSKQIKDLEENKSLFEIFDVAKIQLRQIEEALKNDKQTPETLKKIKTYLSVWKDIDKLFEFTPNSDEQNNVNSIINLANTLSNKYLDALKQTVVDLANEGKPENKKISIKELLKPIKDIGLGKSYLFDSSISEVQLELYIDNLLKDNIRDINEEVNNKHKELDNLIKEAEGKKIFKQLLQTYSNDKLTGNLVSTYKQEFWDKLKELSDKAKKDPKNWKNFWEFMNNNSNRLSISEIEENKSKNFIEEEITKGKELLEQYKKDREAFIEEERDRLEFSEQYKNKDDIDQINLDFQRNLQENIDQWEKENSPFLREKFEKEVNLKKRKASELKGMKGYKYLLKPKPKDEWLDPKFKQVESNPALFKLYNYFKDTLEEYSNFLPDSKNLQSNTIPELKKSYWEEVIANGSSQIFKGAKNSFIERLTTEEISDKEYGVIDEETGKPIKELKTRMLANKLTPEEKSYDLEKVFMSYIDMAAGIKYKSQVESKVLIARELIDEIQEATLNPDGSTRKDWLNRPIVTTNGLKNTKERIDYTINALLYGQRKQLEGVQKKSTYGIFKEKHLVGSKFGDAIIQLTTAKGLALNPFSGITNLFFGKISNRLHAASNQEYGDKDLFIAEAIVAKSILGGESKEKIASLMSDLQVLGEINHANYGDKSIFDKTYIFQKYGEYMIQSDVMVAMLIKNKLYDKIKIEDGKVIYPEGANKKQLSKKIQQTIKYLHGNYQMNSPIKIKEKTWGRMLMVFRNWIPYSFLNRFGSEFYDERLGRLKKGRYISIKDIISEQGWTKGLKSLVKLSLIGKLTGQTVENINSTDVANAKQVMREISLFASLYLMTMLLRGLSKGGDDDKEIYTYFLNTAIRTEADLLFFVSPMAFKQITKDPIPPLKTVFDLVKLVQDTGPWVIGNGKIKSGKHKGDYKITQDLFKNFPILSQIYSIRNLSEKEFQ